MLSTLLSSFISVAALRIGLLRNPGRLGGVGIFSMVPTALWYVGESSGWSKSSRYCGITVWYLFAGPTAIGAVFGGMACEASVSDEVGCCASILGVASPASFCATDMGTVWAAGGCAKAVCGGGVVAVVGLDAGAETSLDSGGAAGGATST